MTPDAELQRRALLQSAVAIAVGMAMQNTVQAASGDAATHATSTGGGSSGSDGAGAASGTAATPARTATPGKPGDFEFLAGEWKIHHRQLKADGRTWDEYEGEATCWSILGGVGSIEELRIPARNFSGMGLRLLDVGQSVWSDFWVNARSGVLTAPGMTGSFENGDGIFIADDVDGDQPIKVRGVWDRITPKSCRWHQGVSRDGGRTWEENWYMDWVRV